MSAKKTSLIFAQSDDPNHPLPKKKVTYKGKEHDSVRVFNSDFIEKFTHVHPSVPLIMWVPVILFFFYKTFFVYHVDIFSALKFGVFGILVWTLFEYCTHRWIFHPPMNSEFSRRVYLLLHGLHHEAPQDPTRLLMPPAASIIFALVLFSIFKPIFGEISINPFFGGFVTGYLIYDYIHYGTHHFRMKSSALKIVKQNHMNHHYVNPNSRFGLSSPMWDYVFGTINDEVPASSKKATQTN